MSNKKRLFISIHHRDEMSLQEGIRKTYGAYHWGVLLAPKKSNSRDNIAYDVSDSVQLDETRQDLNSERDWFFRIKNNVNPLDSGRLVGRVMIGKVPPQTTENDLETILRGVALPDKESGERCRHWVWNAISTLQNESVIPNFDIEEFKVWILDYANQCLANPSPSNLTPNTVIKNGTTLRGCNHSFFGGMKCSKLSQDSCNIIENGFFFLGFQAAHPQSFKPFKNKDGVSIVSLGDRNLIEQTL
ncbi:predicted protein [Histoplasma mississippiense (nom. inval.)]|uniref:predicted protein n=1 Tax=Ajellomyces capsulatus (strain NAm1 / WU24) TaxID=2059318 RepID=UPI000157BCA1|nr:predicted protein [Histoplasma mississippiense (nom. inval.)]EDN06235.1 predicted protein [Histoplasma mississippiense (nom. inval.)]